MLEAQRIAYLEALGITQYVALSPVAGARQLPVLTPEAISPVSEAGPSEVERQPSVRLAEKSEAVESESEVFSPACAESVADVVSGDEQNPPYDEQEIPELDLSKLGLRSAESEIPSPVVSSERLGPFSCLTLPFGSGARIMLQLSSADAPGLNGVEHRMLSDLLCALGEMKMPEQQGARIYRWPIINNARMAADPVAALDAFSAYLSAAEVVSHTLVIGHQVAIALGLATERDAQAVDQLPGRFLALPGFAEMQADWKVKAEAWSRICSFLHKTA